MKNENNQKNKESADSEKNKHKEKIPLWLQGLEEHEDEDTSPTDIGEASVDAWIREISEETQDSPDISTERSHETNEPEKNSVTNPDWLIELSEMDSGRRPVLDKVDEERPSKDVNNLEDFPIQGQEPEEVEIKQVPPENIPAEVDEAFEEFPSPEDEIELTQPPEEVDITGAIDENLHDDISQDEDLPPWLQEMISEPQEAAPDQSLAQEEAIQKDEAEPTDEPTEPLDVVDEPVVKEESEVDEQTLVEEEIRAEKELDQPEGEKETEPEIIPEMKEVDEGDFGLISEPTPSEWIPEKNGVDNIDLEEEPPSFQTPATTIEGDTRPIDVTQEAPESEETVFADEEEEKILEAKVIQPEQAEQVPEGLPENMQNVKDLLARGETDEAIGLLKTLEEKSNYYHELQTWLIDAAYTNEEPGVEFWETLGDITLENEDHEIAVNAYARAIQSLLISREDRNEFS